VNPLARLVLPALRWHRRTGFDHEKRRIEETLALGVGGYILFGGTAEAGRRVIQQIRAAEPHPLLFGTDMERGAAQQFSDLTHLPPPAALGFVGKPNLTARCGQITAREALSVGVNWVYAPDCDLDIEPDNPIIQTRSFGDDPVQVSEQVSAWVTAAEAEGVVSTAKHYPGHGRTTTDSHETLPVVATPLAELEATDLKPFAAAIAAGTRSVMSAHVAYSQWDSSGLPASISPTILGYLRHELQFDGVIVTDALIMEGVLKGRGAGGAAVAAIAAGSDALLYPADSAAVVQALDTAAGSTLDRARLDDALARIAKLAEGAATAPAQGREPNAADDAAFADALADMSLHTLRGEALSLAAPLAITTVDDDVGGPYVVGPRDLFQRRLANRGIATAQRGVAARGSRIVLVYCEPRSWKGRALLGQRSLAALARVAPGAGLIVLFGHPRVAAQIPGTAPILCAWHGQPLMQYAAARWVAARMR
jgi:beta-glucosidase-like glycosyl hydrolase